MANHMGFNKAAASVERREGVSPERAKAIIASGARKASPSAVKKNPNLKRVSGVAKQVEKRVAARNDKR